MTRIGKKKNLSGPVETIQPHPLAMELALFLAGGDVNRLKIINRFTVLVMNNPRPVRKSGK